MSLKLRIDNKSGKGMDTRVYIAGKDMTRSIKPYMTTIRIPADGPVTAKIECYIDQVTAEKIQAEYAELVFLKPEKTDS